MKRIQISLRMTAILLCMAMLLAACSSSGKETKKTEEITYSAGQIISHIYEDQIIAGDVTFAMGDSKDCDESLLSFYGIEGELISDIEDYAIIKPSSPLADEYIVIKSENAGEVKKVLEKYRKQRLGDFTGYAPSEEAKLTESRVLMEGNVVAYLVGEDFDSLKKLFAEVTAKDYELTDADQMIYKMIESMCSNASENSTENSNIDWTNPEEFPDGEEPGTKVDRDGTLLYPEDEKYMTVYDTSKIVEAYKTNDSSILTDEIDLQILRAAKEAIAATIKDGMTAYEKEKAIHDYIVNHAENDSKALEYSTWYMKYSDMPYGVLINKQAVCYGYTITFKMFMDMLDVECLIVCGQATEIRAIHAWNLVKLDDDCWYAVDVTWDDPYFETGISYNYFNVNDGTLLLSSHYWDRKEYPAATGGKYSNIAD